MGIGNVQAWLGSVGAKTRLFFAHIFLTIDCKPLTSFSILFPVKFSH